MFIKVLNFTVVLQEYANVAKRVKLSGPTNFAPLINRAIKIAKGEEHEDAKILVSKFPKMGTVGMVVGTGTPIMNFKLTLLKNVSKGLRLGVENLNLGMTKS